MTREEAIKEMIRAYDVLDFSCHMDNRRKEAFNMAKLALEQEPFKPMVEIDLYSVIKQKYIEREVLDKIIAEIEEIEKNYGFDKATKYGNKNAEQQSLSYSTMMMYEIANIIDEIKEIIDKYKAESEAADD